MTTVNVLGNDGVYDNTLAASITAFTQGMHGSVVSNNNGTFTYTHDDSETISDAFTYTIVDGAGGTATATVTIIVTPVNDAPVGGPECLFQWLLRRDRPQRRRRRRRHRAADRHPGQRRAGDGPECLLHGLLRRDCVIIAGTAAQINAVLAGSPTSNQLQRRRHAH